MTSSVWSQDKMAAISQMTFSNAFSWIKMYEFDLRFNWTLFLPKGTINNIQALVQIRAWCQPGNKPLSETMIVYRCIYVSLYLNEVRMPVLSGVDVWIVWYKWERTVTKQTYLRSINKWWKEKMLYMCCYKIHWDETWQWMSFTIF